MNKTILITQPEYDYTTRYISAWAEKVAQYAKKRNNTVIALKDDRANGRMLVTIIAKTDPSFIFLNGHGSSAMVAGQDDKPLIQNTDNVEFLRKKIIYALSCQSAKHLGPYCITKGVKTYFGYTEDFIFSIERSKRTRPNEDNLAALFLDPSNTIAMSLLKGRNSHEAYNDSQKAFRKSIRTLLTSESKENQTSTIRFLIWDMQHQVCLGNQTATI